MSLKTFKYDTNFEYHSGWDRYALEYCKLLQPNTIYSLTKDLAHNVVKQYIPNGHNKKVLDLNCGTGNDFPFFIKEGYQITGTDGSFGMLNKAYEAYGQNSIQLHQIMMEDFDDASFPENHFDLIYSITGGYSYVDDVTFKKVNNQLAKYLKKGGFLITAHLTPFCLGETIYSAKKLKIKSALKRLQTTLKVPIKGETHKMYLRSSNRLKKLTTTGFDLVSMYPVLTSTPPYQTGYSPNLKKLKKHGQDEMKRTMNSKYLWLADQVMMVERKK